MIVPVRAALLFKATEKLTVPLPLPVLPLVRVINAELLTAVKEQPASVLTRKLPVPPAEGKSALVGDSE